MPLVRIEIIKGKSASYKKELLPVSSGKAPDETHFMRALTAEIFYKISK